MEETIARLLQVFVALAGAYLLALWFALAIWTYRDITARTTNAVVQVLSTLLAVLFFAPGAIIYLILRPRETLDEAFQRSIEEEYLVQDLEEYPLCPSCRRAVRDDFVYCPHCHVELRGACENCRRLIDLRWEICAYCGADQQQARPAAQLLADTPSRVGATADSGPVAIRPQPTLDRPEKRPHWEADDDPQPLITPLPSVPDDAFEPNGADDDALDGVTPADVEALSAPGGRRRGSARRRDGSSN